MELANRTIALFANNDFGDAFFSAFRVVDFITIDKTNQVCILFNGAGFPQIGHLRPAVGAAFNLTVQLRKRHDRHIEFFGQSLQRTADIRYFPFSGIVSITGLHQLNVIHNN